RRYLDLRGATARVRANREMALLSHMLNRAREWGMTEKPNPCQGVRKHREQSRNRYVSDEEYLAVWRAGDQLVRDVMGLALLMGQRPQDLFGLRCADVTAEFVHVEIRKTQRRIRIENTGKLRAMVDELLARKRQPSQGALIVNQRGFDATAAMFKKRFELARDKAGVTFQLRDLRAKNATDTDDLATAQKRLAHTSRSTTERYIRARKGDRVAPLESDME
ncbi:MAG: integrase, partial [Betaproteobacteria bacterium]